MHSWLEHIPVSGVHIEGGGATWQQSDLLSHIAMVEKALQARRMPQAPVAILADNAPDWIAIDLATQNLGLTLIPLPLFFTPAQWMHVIASSGVQAVYCAQPEVAAQLGFTRIVGHLGRLTLCERESVQESAALEGIQKVTFTSGTTADPKGVCLSTQQQWDVAHALHGSLASLHIQRHLSLLPLAVLLENIAGIYTALLAGATVICPPLAEVGLHGASGFDPEKCLNAIAQHQAESIILLPQMLQALVAVASPHDARIASLKFVAVGGAKTPIGLIEAARRKGFPVYEGYGLSECSSVVSLNVPGADRVGSVGKPLSNRSIRIAADHEIEVGGMSAARYLGQAPVHTAWMPTGDIGHIDDDGYLFIDGRKKDILITGYGRNISPEWPESVLLGTGAFAQAIVFGDAQPFLIALVVPLAPSIDAATMQSAIDAANRVLPDYARVRHWLAVAPFSTASGLSTANGRLRRQLIWQHYQQQVTPLFEQSGA